MSKYTKIIAALGVAAGLGVASLPAAGVFADDIVTNGAGDPLTASDEVTVNVNVNETLSLALDADSVTTTMDAGTLDQTMSTKTTVKTNSPDGFKLTVIDKDTSNALEHDDIASHAGYVFAAANVVSGSANGWDISWNNGTNDQEAVVPVSTGTALSLKETTEATPDAGVVTTITYNVRAAADQAAGHYSDVIVYTATANVE